MPFSMGFSYALVPSATSFDDAGGFHSAAWACTYLGVDAYKGVWESFPP